MLISKDIIWFEDSDAENPSFVGGKFANLAALHKARINVPLGFSVSASAYRSFIERVDSKVKTTLASIDFSTLASIERGAENIRAVVTAVTIPANLREEVKEAYRKLAAIVGTNVQNTPVAVRSSATVEDSKDASLAGQHETYLWVKGEEQVIERVVDCWASVFTARSLRYRDSKGLDQLGEDMAVVVQMMVHSTASGVMFTLNPTNGDPSKIFIESSWGFGEAVVRGLVTPDLFTVDKVTFEILERRINRKLKEFAISDSDVIEREIEQERQTKPSISEELVLHLAKLGKTIEKKYGFPQDIEWAVDTSLEFSKNTFILQARPETVWSQKNRASFQRSGDAIDVLVDKLIRGERLGG